MHDCEITPTDGLSWGLAGSREHRSILWLSGQVPWIPPLSATLIPITVHLLSIVPTFKHHLWERLKCLKKMWKRETALLHRQAPTWDLKWEPIQEPSVQNLLLDFSTEHRDSWCMQIWWGHSITGGHLPTHAGLWLWALRLPKVREVNTGSSL